MHTVCVSPHDDPLSASLRSPLLLSTTTQLVVNDSTEHGSLKIGVHSSALKLSLAALKLSEIVDSSPRDKYSELYVGEIAFVLSVSASG